jgi:hypothetical protein
MSAVFWVITIVVLSLAPLFILLSLGGAPLWPAVGLLIVLCVATWLTMRPTCFHVTPTAFIIEWPLRRREIPRREIASARVVGGKELRGMLGVAARVGVGGLWGTFGGLWSKKLGWVSTYVSRTDELLWVELASGKTLLLTPESPNEVCRLLSESP